MGNNDNNACEDQVLDDNCEIRDCELCYWLSHKVGCDHCYIKTLKTKELKEEARERWETTISLLPQDIDALHESEECQLCKGEPQKADGGYAIVEMAHPEPYFAKGLIFGLGKKVRVPVGSLVSVQMSVSKKAKNALRNIDIISILSPVIALAVGIILLMVPQIAQPMADVFVLLPIIFLALMGVAGYFIGSNLGAAHLRKIKDTVKVDISEVPQIQKMLDNGWFFFQTANGGMPRLSFSKKKQYCRLLRERPVLKDIQSDRDDDLPLDNMNI